MPQICECPHSGRFALLRENRLPPEERKELLLHIADCNECAMKYTIFASLMEGEEETSEERADETVGSQCPPLGIFALFLEGKLGEAKRTKVLRHMAYCSECAMAFSIAREMRKGSVDEANPGAQKRKPFPRLFYLRYFTQTAAIVLLAVTSFFGGFHAHRVSFLTGTQENEYARVQEFESSPLYWSRLNDLVQNEKLSAQVEGLLGTKGSQNVPPVQEILGQKRDFDQCLSEIASLSDQDINTILSVDGLDIPAMTPSDIKIYAAFLKDGRVQELQKSEKWIRYDQSAYFSLAGQLPPEVWERYPLSRESFNTLSWIAGLPNEKKGEILALSPEEASQERKKGEAQNTP